MEPAVSYVVTVYNKEPFLRAVLDSIAMECKDTGGEIIIIDDGSTDGSARMLAEFAGSYSNVTVITQENAGVAGATTRGIMAAKEPYLRLVDGDDALVAGSTRHLAHALESTSSGFAYGRFTGEISTNPKIITIADPLHRMLQRQPFVPACTLGLTAIMQQAMPLSPRYRTSQDFALGLKLAGLTGFVETTALCCIQPVDAAGLSADKGRMFRETALIAAELGQAWPARYKRQALARNAGRARNYLRRHVPGKFLLKAEISLLAAIARIPFFWPYKRLMIHVANAYNQP